MTGRTEQSILFLFDYYSKDLYSSIYILYLCKKGLRRGESVSRDKTPFPCLRFGTYNRSSEVLVVFNSILMETCTSVTERGRVERLWYLV